MSKPSFRYIDHTSDAVIEAYGQTLNEAFANCAKGLVNIICDISMVRPGKHVFIQVTGFDRKNLLYNWLEKVLLTLLLDNIVLAEFDVTTLRLKDKYNLSSMCRGEIFARQKHKYKVEVKAVTYHGMKISRRKSIFVVKFLVDL